MLGSLARSRYVSASRINGKIDAFVPHSSMVASLEIPLLGPTILVVVRNMVID